MRRMPMRSAAPARPKYLFAERGSPYEITLMLADRLKKELASIPQQVLLKTPPEALIDEIVQRYALNVPTLDRNNITEFEPVETKLQVSQNSQYGFFAGPGPHFVNATAFQIRIPFTGDQNLFRHSTTSFGNPIEGEVVDDAIVLTHIAKDPDVETVNREFSDRMGRIETTLQLLRGQVSQWNNGLMSQVKPAVEKRMATIQRNQSMSLGYQRAAAPTESAQAPFVAAGHTTPRQTTAEFDVFLSHASEDKDAIARPLYEALTAAGVTVWFDEAVLHLGDRLRRKIDDGLARCNYGIIIVSPSFLSKDWPRLELDGLAAREVGSKTIILPIWHDIDKAAIIQKSPTLADRLAAKSTEGIPALVEKILKVVRQ
jgi:hypothetical protein